MASKKVILKKLRILITQEFKSAEEAFSFFDKNEDGFLTKGELKNLIKKAKVSRLISGLVADSMLDGLDGDNDKKFNWQEFKAASASLIQEGLKKDEAVA